MKLRHMLRFYDSTVSVPSLPWPWGRCRLPLVSKRSAHGNMDFGDQWLACVSTPPPFFLFPSMFDVGRSMFNVRSDSFILCFKPVYPGAFTDLIHAPPPLRPRTAVNVCYLGLTPEPSPANCKAVHLSHLITNCS